MLSGSSDLLHCVLSTVRVRLGHAPSPVNLQDGISIVPFPGEILRHWLIARMCSNGDLLIRALIEWDCLMVTELR